MKTLQQTIAEAGAGRKEKFDRALKEHLALDTSKIPYLTIQVDQPNLVTFSFQQENWNPLVMVVSSHGTGYSVGGEEWDGFNGTPDMHLDLQDVLNYIAYWYYSTMESYP
jgi:hypothetical protein